MTVWRFVAWAMLGVLAAMVWLALSAAWGPGDNH